MNYGQLDLFNFKPVDKKTEHILDVREKCPDDIAIVWTATELGNNSDPHYFLNVEDAKKLCSGLIGALFEPEENKTANFVNFVIFANFENFYKKKRHPL